MNSAAVEAPTTHGSGVKASAAVPPCPCGDVLAMAVTRRAATAMETTCACVRLSCDREGRLCYMLTNDFHAAELTK